MTSGIQIVTKTPDPSKYNREKLSYVRSVIEIATLPDN
jgi:hypothetical protein